jgi:hypothetical protein
VRWLIAAAVLVVAMVMIFARGLHGPAVAATVVDDAVVRRLTGLHAPGLVGLFRALAPLSSWWVLNGLLLGLLLALLALRRFRHLIVVLTSSLPWKDRDSSTGRGRSVGSRFIGWPWCAEASPRSHPVPPGGSCGAGLGYHPDSPTVASAPDSRGPVLGGCTAFLPGLKAGASCGGVR